MVHGKEKRSITNHREIKHSNSRFTKKIKLNSRITEKIRGGQFTVHEENKTQFTVHSKNKSPITVHGNTSLRPSYNYGTYGDACFHNIVFPHYNKKYSMMI